MLREPAQHRIVFGKCVKFGKWKLQAEKVAGDALGFGKNSRRLGCRKNFAANVVCLREKRKQIQT
ncbi:hypothetical protein DCC62_02280 [candidate division KSB1 bacterium]|nr:MAG: hypothetical protein DCC62_02280 [candidate division KSB1 bacterium]